MSNILKIKTLRERSSGVSIMKCKEALEKFNYNIDEALNYLSVLGLLNSSSKSNRAANERVVKIFKDDSICVIVELKCETDFVAKNQKFIELINFIGENTLLGKDFIEDQDQKEILNQKRANLIQLIGENILVSKIDSFSLDSDKTYGVYSHNNKKAVIVVSNGKDDESENRAKDVAMHILAYNPEYISRSEIPQKIIDLKKESIRSEILNKPSHIVEKIMLGKLDSFFSDTCLLDQKFMKDESKTVSEFLKDSIDKIIKINIF